MTDDDALLAEVQRLFEEALQVEAPDADADIIDGGLLDSLSLVTLLFELEQVYGVRIPLETLEIDDVRTLRRLAGLVSRQRAVASARLEDRPPSN